MEKLIGGLKKGAKATGKIMAHIAVLIISKLSFILIPVFMIGIIIVGFFWGSSDVTEDIEKTEGTSFSGSTGNSILVGDSIEEKIWWALLDAGFSPKQTAAAMGHMTGECGGGERKIRTDTGGGNVGNSNGRGMCGWLDVYSGQDLVAYAESKGTTWDDPDTQIQFLVSWLTWEGDAAEYVKRHNSNRGGIPGTGGNGIYYQSGAWREGKETDDVEGDLMYLTWAFYVNYGAGSDSSQWDNESIGKDFRYKSALSFYNEFKTKSKPALTVNTESGSASGSLKGTREGIYTSACSGLSYKTFLQNPVDGAGWSHDQGCWATINATILSAFGWDGTPNQTMSWPWGTSQNYSKMNLKYEQVYNVNVNDIVNYLDKGQAIHIRVEGERRLYTYNCPGGWPFSHHSLAILDYRYKDGKYEFYVHDPYNIDNTYGWGDAETIASALVWYEHVWK